MSIENETNRGGSEKPFVDCLWRFAIVFVLGVMLTFVLPNSAFASATAATPSQPSASESSSDNSANPSTKDENPKKTNSTSNDSSDPDKNRLPADHLSDGEDSSSDADIDGSDLTPEQKKQREAEALARTKDQLAPGIVAFDEAAVQHASEEAAEQQAAELVRLEEERKKEAEERVLSNTATVGYVSVGAAAICAIVGAFLALRKRK